MESARFLGPSNRCGLTKRITLQGPLRSMHLRNSGFFVMLLIPNELPKQRRQHAPKVLFRARRRDDFFGGRLGSGRTGRAVDSQRREVSVQNFARTEDADRHDRAGGKRRPESDGGRREDKRSKSRVFLCRTI